MLPPRMQMLLDQVNAFKARRDELDGVEHVPLVLEGMQAKPLLAMEATMRELNARGDKFVAKLDPAAIQAARDAVAADAAAMEVAPVEAKK